MSHYSIKELEKLSGIKAHTIRIWEKRYRIVKPDRSDTNIRSYSDDDLKKIINVSLLNHHGLKISKIADLTDDELREKVFELGEKQGDAELHIDRLITSMIDLDEEKFEGILKKQVARFGLEHAMTQIVYPFLERIGVLWQTGNITPAQEHFISNLIRQKVIVAIDELPQPPKDAPKALLFLPDEELHELGLLFYHYVTRKCGMRTFYLGQMVPYGDVKSICQVHQPKFLITSMTSPPPSINAQQYLTQLCKDHPKCKVLATGRALKDLKFSMPKNLRLFFMLEELKKEIGY